MFAVGKMYHKVSGTEGDHLDFIDTELLSNRNMTVAQCTYESQLDAFEAISVEFIHAVKGDEFVNIALEAFSEEIFERHVVEDVNVLPDLVTELVLEVLQDELSNEQENK